MNIKNAPNRVILCIDVEKKNWHTFENGQKIRLERQWNNLNQRETEPVNGICVSSDFIPVGSEVIIDHKATHPVYRMFDYKTDGDISPDIKYYSIPEWMCYLYRLPDTEEWLPCKNFETGLRVFKPYNGPLAGIEPELIINKLYITSGEMKGKVVMTLKASDYEMIFQGLNGREQRVIRCRHFPNGEAPDRQEIVGIDNFTTDLVNCGEIYVGLTPSDAKPISNG